MALISLRQMLDHAAEHDYGVPAFNINNMEQVSAISGQYRKITLENRAEFDPRKFQLPGWHAMRELYRDRFERFNSTGRASKIKIIPLPQMAARYQSN
jgi:fructose-bisphosphate aldolase class II